MTKDPPKLTILHNRFSFLLRWKAGDRYDLWLEVHITGEYRSYKEVGDKGTLITIYREFI